MVEPFRGIACGNAHFLMRGAAAQQMIVLSRGVTVHTFSQKSNLAWPPRDRCSARRRTPTVVVQESTRCAGEAHGDGTALIQDGRRATADRPSAGAHRSMASIYARGSLPRSVADDGGHPALAPAPGPSSLSLLSEPPSASRPLAADLPGRRLRLRGESCRSTGQHRHAIVGSPRTPRVRASRGARPLLRRDIPELTATTSPCNLSTT